VVSIPLTPIRMSGFAPEVRLNAPERGADNAELRSAYPCDDAEWAAMSGLEK
jgi:crotonobetainyl-CoA:carnitine CoA-transferase CaiB-like acyl-CoA transferase